MTPPSTPQIPSVVREIESRVEQLIADHKRLTKLNGELINQRNDLLQTKQQLQERVMKLERELTMTQLRGGLKGGTKSNARARAYINRLLREVDACIACLSSPEGREKGEEVRGEAKGE